eukprot:4345754-Lingulodinium_polyedra.AAC.1
MRILHWIHSKLKSDTSLVWGVQDLLLGETAEGRKSLSKPLHRSQKLVQGTTKSNGLPQWVLELACAKIYGISLTVVKKLGDNTVLRMVQFAGQYGEAATIEGVGQLPELVVEELYNRCLVLLPMLQKIDVSEKLNWSTDIGHYLLCKWGEDSEKLDAIMHHRSRMKKELPESFH